MTAVLIFMWRRHVNVIPVKVDVTNRGLVETIAQCFCTGLNGWRHQLWYSQNCWTADGLNIAYFRWRNSGDGQFSRKQSIYFIELYLVGWVIKGSNIGVRGR